MIIDDKLREILEASSFEVIPGTWIYAKVASLPNEKHFMISQDNDEITVVTTEDKLSNLELIERNEKDYALICLNVSVPFYSVGFLASVSNAIAEQGMNVLIISTYSKDYILVKKDQIDTAQNALKSLGMKRL